MRCRTLYHNMPESLSAHFVGPRPISLILKPVSHETETFPRCGDTIATSMSGAPAPVPNSGKAVSREHLVVLQVRKVIFHDVPRKVKGQDAKVTLSETTCALNPGKVTLLKDKLIRVLASSAAYDLELNPQGQSSIPGIVESVTGSPGGDKNFVSASQDMAVA